MTPQLHWNVSLENLFCEADFHFFFPSLWQLELKDKNVSLILNFLALVHLCYSLNQEDSSAKGHIIFGPWRNVQGELKGKVLGRMLPEMR